MRMGFKMSKCGVCGNDMIICTCPRGLGGGSGADDTEDENRLYNEKVEQVASYGQMWCMALGGLPI
jgi:hypothetical protein